MNKQNQIDQSQHDQRLQYLLNGSLDGELSATEKDEFDGVLESSGKVRNLYGELKAVTGLLDDLPEHEPPHYLQNAIESQIRLPVPGTGNENKQGFFGSWLPAHWLGTGFAVAAGMILTIGVYELGSEPISPGDSARMVGTVVKNPAAAQGKLIDSIHIYTQTLNGLVELHNKDDLLSLNVQLNWDGPTEVIVNLAGHELQFAGITREQDRNDVVSSEDGSIKVVSSGEQRYILKLRRTSATQSDEPLKLEFFANNSLVHAAELDISKL